MAKAKTKAKGSSTKEKKRSHSREVVLGLLGIIVVLLRDSSLCLADDAGGREKGHPQKISLVATIMVWGTANMHLFACNLGGFAVQTHTASQSDAGLSIRLWIQRFVFITSGLCAVKISLS